MLPFLTISLYSIKPVFEKVLPTIDMMLQFFIIGFFILDLIKRYKLNLKLKFEIYLILFGLLILINGLFNAYYIDHTRIEGLYTQGLLNYSFIFIACIYLLNTINSKEEFINILRLTRFNIILLFIISLYDIFFLGLNRAGNVVNPNYLSQMTLILLIFYIYSSKKKLSLSSVVYYAMGVTTVFLTASSSGLMGLCIIGLIIMLYIIKKKELTLLIYHLFWIITAFYMSIIISTSNYTYGLLKYVVKTEDTSRVDIWKYTFEEFLKSPLMGGFYNSFLAPWNGYLFVTHNDYLRLLVELGILGLLLLFLFGRKQLKKSLYYNSLDSYFLLALIMVTLSYSLSHNNINNLMFWLAFLLPSFKVFKNKK